MNILVLLGDFHGVGFQRGLLPYHWVARMAGHNVTVAPGVPMNPPAEGEAADHFRTDRCIYTWDMVVAQLSRNDESEAFLREYKRRGGRILFEIDDSYRNIPVGNPARANLKIEMVECLERCLAMADAATTTTDTLAGYYRHLQPNMFVARNALDPHQYGPLLDSGEPPDDGTLRVGWAGSQGHLRDVEMIVRPMTKFLKAHPHAQFVVAGSDWRGLFPRTVHPQIRFAGSTFDPDPDDPKGQKVKLLYQPGESTPAERYPKFLYDLYLHFAIAPILPSEWNAAKSELKLLEYGALGIPAIASDWTPYREYYDRAAKRDDLGGSVCLLAKTEDEWLAALFALAADRDLRDRLRRANRHFVLTEHLIHQRLGEWMAAIDFVMAQGPQQLMAADFVQALLAAPMRVFAA
jgi:glycosyltransferase involved in cell wall biosynthesis